MSGAVAVFDLGSSNSRLALVDDGVIVDSRATASRRRDGPPYPYIDVGLTWDWMLAALADLARAHDIAAIVVTTHGSGAALLDPDGAQGLALPVMYYEAEPPNEVRAAYAAEAPPYEECFAPVLPVALTLGLQLYWQEAWWPDDFARARHIVTLPQYWAWRLCGEAAVEATSLGAQGQMWAPVARDFSSLVDRHGWRGRFPPLRPAWEALGPLKPELAGRAGLPLETPVLCGIHDSNANYLRYLAAGRRSFSLLSTGTWIIGFNPRQDLKALDSARDMVSNTDARGAPVASSRFMGGREYALLAGEAARDVAATAADAATLIAQGTLALPDFSGTGGPYLGRTGRIVGPVPATPGQHAALATLYTALVTDTCLDLLGPADEVIVDGAFADNALFCGLIAALRTGQPVRVSDKANGTVVGAALLWGWEARTAAAPLSLRDVAPAEVAGLADYAERWRAMADSP